MAAYYPVLIGVCVCVCVCSALCTVIHSVNLDILVEEFNCASVGSIKSQYCLVENIHQMTFITVSEGPG